MAAIFYDNYLKSVLPVRDCPFHYRNKISPKSKLVHERFVLKNIFRDSKKIFCDFSVGMELENENIESVNENENKENKNVDEFQEYFLQQIPAKTKAKKQSNVKAWKFGQDGWILASFSFCVFMDRDFVKRTWPMFSHLDLALGQ